MEVPNQPMPESGQEAFPVPPVVPGMEQAPVEGVPPMGGEMPPEMPSMGGEMPIEGEGDLPEGEAEIAEEVANTEGEEMKKQLLQRLMDDLLDKPGRSLHELINGMKEVISAYKNYAKEYDSISGAVSGEEAPMEGGVPPEAAATSAGLQDILRGQQGE